ncbi:putative monooxygenase [Nocardia nova SH22a]|uniref:Putative monooxygenase n=1 Tax=Nocardia nova SH22a TaxID=1415166 RepID=W5TRC9_9NOCA|nr:NAD(P)/FAD-dependent oxidoreductase [Nocardia nova]AHH19801.1 putative monooxygenase [Nocardia nova SH22a]
MARLADAAGEGDEVVTGAAGPRGRVGIVGAGPAGMAAALSLGQAGHDVTILERYPAAEPRGNIINLWPPPVKALGLLGVDIDDLGAPCQTIFGSSSGRRRAVIHISDELQAEYGGDFIGLLRPDLYSRMRAALPEGVIEANLGVVAFTQDIDGVHVQLSDGTARDFDVLVGADGINSLVRRTLWGETPPREHNLHIFGGYTVEPIDAARGVCMISWSRTVQASWTSIRSLGRDGFEWWVIEAHSADEPFDEDYHATATRLAADFPSPMPELVALTDPAHMHRWVLRDRKPLPRWSKGRATIIGDAAHPTSPYAGYGAGMSIEDAYFLGRRLAGVDLKDQRAVEAALTAFEEPRRKHTARQSQQAYILSQMFHHAPRVLHPLREFVLDHTPFLQKVAADGTPGEIMKQVDVIQHTEDAFRARIPSTATDPEMT